MKWTDYFSGLVFASKGFNVINCVCMYKRVPCRGARHSCRSQYYFLVSSFPLLLSPPPSSSSSRSTPASSYCPVWFAAARHLHVAVVVNAGDGDRRGGGGRAHGGDAPAAAGRGVGGSRRALAGVGRQGSGHIGDGPGDGGGGLGRRGRFNPGGDGPGWFVSPLFCLSTPSPPSGSLFPFLSFLSLLLTPARGS